MKACVTKSNVSQRLLMLTEFMIILIAGLLFIIFLTDGISSSEYVQDTVSSEIPNMIEER